jgi:hypothetical protein
MYGIEDPSFDGCREQELIRSIIDVINNKDTDEFTAKISGYN